MLCHNNIILKVFDMKGKRQKKRNDELPMGNSLSKIQQAFPLKISFNLCKESIACFVGQKKNCKKRSQRMPSSLQKVKASVPKSLPKVKEQKKDKEVRSKVVKTQCQQIIQGSLNQILCQIQAKGIDCQWKESEQSNKQTPQEILDSQNSQLWKAFSVNSSFSKSYASTVDVHPNINYYQNLNYNAQSYYYDYSYKTYQEGNMFIVIPEYISNDIRTTIMIRNIPNKYTIRELSEEIDREFSNTYDFLYLPCDIKNQCNVGYGFINFLNTSYLYEFYQRFQGIKWCRFRSQKICNLTYARLQGLANLIEHFENSKVQKDKRYRPIIRQYSQIAQLVRSQQLH